MSILVLGVGGMVGSAVAREGVRRGLQVHGVLRPRSSIERLVSCGQAMSLHYQDLNDRPALTRLIKHCAPEAIVQAAFPTGLRRQSPESRRQLLQQTLACNLDIFDAMRLAEFTGHLVLVGSATSYGGTGFAHHPSEPLQPSAFRGVVKGAESLLVAQYARQSRIAATELRVFTAYGPWDHRRKLLPRLFAAALSGDRVRLTTRSHRRDWVHVEDVARACIDAGERPSNGPSVFNVCSGRMSGTHEVARLVEQITGCALISDQPYAGEDDYGDEWPAGVLPRPEEGFDWQPQIDLESGLRTMWDWARTTAGRQYLLSGQERAAV